MVNVYCPNCGHDSYRLREYREFAEYDEFGSPVENGAVFNCLEPYCPECGTVFFVEEIHEENLRREAEAQREFHDLATEGELKLLPKRYGVSRENVSIILNLESELMLNDVQGRSVWKGAVLTSDETKRVRMAVGDAGYFLDMLDRSRYELPGEVYERVRPRIARMK